MPIVRKVIPFGKSSRAIILPKSWLEFYEKQKGQPIESVAIEVDKILKISPLIEGK